MGTNYYLKTDSFCPMCKHSEERSLHIGKSSAGWNFGLRIYPNPDTRLDAFGVSTILELDDWRPLFLRFQIFNEYGEQITADDMIETITKRSHPRGLLSRLTAGPEHMGPYHRPNADRERAGKGTYDLCNYEFS